MVESNSREYKTWMNIKTRCYNENTPFYKHYGGRGISVYDGWRESYDAFLQDMGRRPGKGYSIDRIDVDGDYEPSNCRWATTTQQARNTRKNNIIRHNGMELCLEDWAEFLGIKSNTINCRLRRGWSTEEALEMVPRYKPRYNGRMTEKMTEAMYYYIDVLGWSQVHFGMVIGMDSSAVSRLYRRFKTAEERAIRTARGKE